MKRFQARAGGGRFVRNTPENSLGMHFNIHERKPDGEWCGAFNPSNVGEPRPTHCHVCGGSMRRHQRRINYSRKTAMTEPTPPTPGGEEPPDCVVRDAIRASLLSPCRSKRGAVVFAGDTVFTSGCNYQVQPFTCDSSDACKARCRRTAVHAEQVALIGSRQLVRGCDLLHVKTVDGQLVPSGPPSCVECSKLAVLSGIAGVWLYHADGWVRYDSWTFHQLSVSASPFLPAGAPTPGLSIEEAR